jgi:hypothetical protein
MAYHRRETRSRAVLTNAIPAKGYAPSSRGARMGAKSEVRDNADKEAAMPESAQDEPLSRLRSGSSNSLSRHPRFAPRGCACTSRA